MKVNFMTSAIVVLIATFTLEPLLANAKNALSPLNKNENFDIGGPGKKGKKKAKKTKKSNHKKLKRKFCTYCPPVRVFDKGQVDASFSAGLIPTYLMDKATVLLPPISVGVDYRISEKFSLGVAAGHSISESRPINTPEGILVKWTNNSYNFGIKPGVHFPVKDNWEIYGGFQIGLNYSKMTGKTDFKQVNVREIGRHMGIHENVYSPSFFGYTGVRFVVSPKWTINTEIGFGISILNIGCTYLLRKEEVKREAQL